MPGGYTGKICFVDLTSGEIQIEKLTDTKARNYIGGQGLGARTLFERQPKGADPLGPENILGFTTGPLTGTKTPTGGRYMVVCKSPLTGGWGDANSGGYFGSELKAAGLDAVYVSGKSVKPVYLLIQNGKLELRDASHLWGQDTISTEEALRSEIGEKRLRVASIGPASERLSLISGICNDGGRFAARSGVGAVMGSKQLKAVAVRGSDRVAVANADLLDSLRKKFIHEIKEMPGFIQVLREQGTCGLTGALIAGGGTPIKNWQYYGEQAFPGSERVSAPEGILKYQTRKFACANCPIACGGIVHVNKGQYPLGETHKPEYETIGAFGPLCMNNDLESIFKLNDMCNRSGLDTISAGTVLAFAMECYEEGVLTKADTDGIELNWGNSKAMVAMTEKIILREGLGDILADGVKLAAEKIGGGAHTYAMHIGGQEPGLHSALYLPSRGTGYVCDPTPGRHTAAPMARIDGGPGEYAPYPEMKIGNFERYEYSGKGPISARASAYLQVGASAGVCLMPMMFFGNFPLLDFMNAVTGWDTDMAEILNTGNRLMTLRQAFNIRESIEAGDVQLPNRMKGIPALTQGPLANVTIDIENLAREYRQAMGWDADTASPTDETLERLGLAQLVAEFG
jgi:aldehyde:ferredoxin oxidoreductase